MCGVTTRQRRKEKCGGAPCPRPKKAKGRKAMGKVPEGRETAEKPTTKNNPKKKEQKKRRKVKSKLKKKRTGGARTRKKGSRRKKKGETESEGTKQRKEGNKNAEYFHECGRLLRLKKRGQVS